MSYAPSGGALAATLETPFPDWTGGTEDIWIREPDGTWRFLVTGRDPAWQPRNPYPVGLVDPATGEWYLRDTAGAFDSFYYGNPGDLPFMGDWDCDGRDTVSVYRPSSQRIFAINELGTDGVGLGAADVSYVFGNPGDTPFVGDFDGDNIDTIGLYRASTGLMYFRNADAQFYFRHPTETRSVDRRCHRFHTCRVPAAEHDAVLPVHEHPGRCRRPVPLGRVRLDPRHRHLRRQLTNATPYPWHRAGNRSNVHTPPRTVFCRSGLIR